MGGDQNNTKTGPSGPRIFLAQDPALRDDDHPNHYAAPIGGVIVRGQDRVGDRAPVDAAVVDVRSQSFDAVGLCRSLKQRMPAVLVVAVATPEQLAALESTLAFEHLPDRIVLAPISTPRLTAEVEALLVRGPGAEPWTGAGSFPPFAEVLSSLFRLKQTGVLDVTAGEVRARLYFQSGRPVFAEHGTLGDTLGRVLLRRGYITRLDYLSAIDRMTEQLVDNEEIRLGEVLVQLGILEPEQVYDALREQAREKLLTCFQWEDCRYQFRSGGDRVERIGVFETHSVARLVLEGTRTRMDFARLDLMLGAFGARYPVLVSDFGAVVRQYGLAGPEARFIRRIRGDATIDALRGGAELPPLVVASLVAALLWSGTLEPLAAPASGTGAADEEPIAEAPAADRVEGAVLGRVQLVAAPTDVVTPAGRDQQPDRAAQVTTSGPGPAGPPPARRARSKRAAPPPAVHTATAGTSGSRELGAPMTEKQRRLSAEQSFQQGKRFLRLNRFAEAYERFDRAASLVPEFPEYRMHREWTTFRSATDESAVVQAKAQARSLALDVLAHDPEVAKAHFILGYFLMMEREVDAAERRLRLAIEHDPDDTEAIRALRLLQRRKGR